MSTWQKPSAGTTKGNCSRCDAVSLITQLRHPVLVDGAVTVHMPGGELSVTIGEGYNLRLAGPVRAVASGCFAADLEGSAGGFVIPPGARCPTGLVRGTLTRVPIGGWIAVDFAIRPATAADAPEVLRVTHGANAEFIGRWALSAHTEQLSHVLRDIAAEHVFVAMAPGRCVGSVRCNPFGGRSGEIKRLAVVPNARRRGAGTRLMDAAEGWLAAVGVSRVTLVTVAENIVATEFYSGRGYAVVSTQYEADHDVVTHTWEKVLAAPGAEPQTSESASTPGHDAARGTS